MSERARTSVDAARRWADTLPTRVALRATVAVAGLYLLLSAAVVVIVTHNLGAAVDQHITSGLVSIQQTGHIGSTAPAPPGLGDQLSRRGPLLVWVVTPDGSTVPVTRGTTYSLPESAWHVTGPETISISGADVRVAGGPIGPVSVNGGPPITAWVVVGQSVAAVYQARDTMLIAEIVVFPFLLVLVFVGSLTVGRRVAEPLERARKRQLEFTADASHELRTPLSVIEAEATLALAMPRSEDSYRAGFQRVDAESKRLRRLVDDLLWLARFDAAPDPPGSEMIDLGVLAGGAVERFRPVAERRSQQLSASVNGALPPLITAPPDWLDRLLGVLLDNACRYSGDGGQILVSVASDSSQVRLSVEDSGPGIPPDERHQVFDRFHRASTTPGGAGLGLAIGDAVVRASGGRWSVGESRWGGASMTVTWPRSAGGQRAA